MNLSGFDRVVWAACFYGHIALLLVLWIRHQAKSFPVFTAYVVENIVKTIVLYFVFYHFRHRTYVNCYWLLAIVDEAIQFLVVFELAVKIFCPTGIWAPDVRRTFLGLVCASSVVAFCLTWLAHPTASDPIPTFIARSSFFSAALMSELFVGMVVLSSTAGLPWKTHVARIAQGLGAYSIVCTAKGIIVNYVGLSQHGRLYTELSHVRIVTYFACEVYWVVMLWQEAPAPRELPETMRVQIFTLQRQVEDDLMRIRSWRRN